MDKDLELLNGKPVLTVSDIPGSANHDICVRFITENNKIRLRINVDSVQAGNLTMSSQLLRLAEIVPAQPK